MLIGYLYSMEDQLLKSHPEAAQHNILVRAPLKLNISESRMFALALGCIRKGDTALPKIRIRIEDVFPNEGGMAYDMADKATTGLMGKIVQLQTVSGKSKITEKYSIFSYLKLDSGSGLITGWFDDRIAPYLLNLAGRFTVVEIETLLSLKSAHTQRVFWILKSHMWEGGFEIELTEFRKQMLGEDHLSHYPNYADFKRYILLPVVEEIQRSGWAIELHEIKPGLRKVIGLKFVLPNYEEPNKTARKAKEKDEKTTRATLVKEKKRAANKTVMLPEPGELQLPAWLKDHPKFNGEVQYKRLISKFAMTALDAKRIMEELSCEADFLRLTKTMLDVQAPPAGQPPIANLAAVLKARLAR